MKLNRGIRVLSGCAVLLLAATAGAQEEDAPVEAAPEAAPPVEETAPPPEETAAEVAEEPVAEPVAEAGEVEVEEGGTSGLSYLVFADAYASFQTAAPGSAAPSYRAYDSNNDFRNQDGFGLSFVGLDLNYDTGKFGATASFRAGPSVNIYFVDPRMVGPVSILQGFVTWKPTDAITLDLGMFGTIFGAEVAESWMNMNYTRGALYYQMQPFWHTGLRASFDLTEELAIKAMLVDDANQISLLQATPGGNSTMQAAVQLAYASGGFSGAVGTLQTLGEGALSGFDRFVDLVLAYSGDNYGVLFNGDLNVADNGGGTFYGLSLAGNYFFVPEFGVAARVEYLDLDADVSDTEILTATLTLDVRPVSGSENLILRWDNRIESSFAADAFVNRDNGPTSAWFSSTVGLVAYTDGMF